MARPAARSTTTGRMTTTAFVASRRASCVTVGAGSLDMPVLSSSVGCAAV